MRAYGAKEISRTVLFSTLSVMVTKYPSTLMSRVNTTPSELRHVILLSAVSCHTVFTSGAVVPVAFRPTSKKSFSAPSNFTCSDFSPDVAAKSVSATFEIRRPRTFATILSDEISRAGVSVVVAEIIATSASVGAGAFFGAVHILISHQEPMNKINHHKKDPSLDFGFAIVLRLAFHAAKPELLLSRNFTIFYPFKLRIQRRRANHQFKM